MSYNPNEGNIVAVTPVVSPAVASSKDELDYFKIALIAIVVLVLLAGVLYTVFGLELPSLDIDSSDTGVIEAKAGVSVEEKPSTDIVQIGSVEVSDKAVGGYRGPR